MAYIGRQQDGFGVRSRFIYTATGGQTTFNTDDSGNALSYADGAYVDVYLNGVLLDPADYTDTSLTSIVLGSGATASDILEVIVYDVFSVFSGTFTNGITANTATVTGDLTVDTNTLFVDSTNNRVGIGTTSPSDGQLHIKGTDTTNQVIIENTDDGSGAAPDLTLRRTSASPADDDGCGEINFQSPYVDLPKKMTVEQNLSFYSRLYGVKNFNIVIENLVDDLKIRDLIKKNAKADEVYMELKTQIEIVLNMGLKPSHLDSHMFTLGLRQDLIDIYINLGKEYKLPIFLSKKLIKLVGEDPNKFVLPESTCFESVFMGSYDIFQSKGLFSFYDNVIDELAEGISFLLIHPALKTDEMDQIALDHPNFGSDWRSKDYSYFTSEKCKKKLKENSIELINWKSPIILNYLDA